MERLDDSRYAGSDRRKYPRINKNFILTYFHPENPSEKNEITQLKNISLGGMCFVATKNFPLGTKLNIELRTPYLSDKANLKGHILESREKIKGVMYQIRLAFDGLDPEEEFLLKSIVDYFVNKKGNDNGKD